MARFGEINSDDNTTVWGSSSQAAAAPTTLDLNDNDNTYIITNINQAITINLGTGNLPAGRTITLILVNDGVLGRLVTFGTNLLSTGTLLGVVSTRSIIQFVSGGTNFYEVSISIGV